MKKMLILLALTITATSAFAETKNFTKKVSKNNTSIRMCVWNQGGCSVDELEATLLEKCYNSGFTTCTTVKKDKSSQYKGSDMFCGDKYKQTCFVVVQGKNE